MKKSLYFLACFLLYTSWAKADLDHVTPQYLDGIIRAYRALGDEDKHTKAKTVCALYDKYQTALKEMGNKQSVIIPFDSQVNIFLRVDRSEAAAFGQKLQEVYATELKTCKKS